MRVLVRSASGGDGPGGPTAPAAGASDREPGRPVGGGSAPRGSAWPGAGEACGTDEGAGRCAEIEGWIGAKPEPHSRSEVTGLTCESGGATCTSRTAGCQSGAAGRAKAKGQGLTGAGARARSGA